MEYVGREFSIDVQIAHVRLYARRPRVDFIIDDINGIFSPIGDFFF